MSDIRKFFTGSGDGGEEKHDKCAEKRKLSQKEYDRNKRKRKMQASWIGEFEWAALAVADEINGEQELFCSVCRKFPKLSDPKSSLVIGIKDNFRRETLKFHAKSRKHILCVEHEMVTKNPEASEYSKIIQRVDTKNFACYERLFRTAYYIATRCEPFSKFQDICELQSSNDTAMGTAYFNIHGCKTFTEVIASVITQETCEQIQNSRFVSVLMDGSTDRSIIEQEVVYVRFVNSNGQIEVKLADIMNLEHGHAKGVKEGMVGALANVGLTGDSLAKKLVGINTDGAAVNLGKKGGAVKLVLDELKEQYNAQECDRYITVVHCVAHNLELAVCDAKKDCKYFRRFEEVVKGIFNLYYYSPKRRRGLYEIADSLDLALKHFGGVKDVRWIVSQNRALNSILINYQVTIIHLGEIASGKDESAAKAKNYLGEMKSFRFLKMLHFMLDFTELVGEVSKLFQLRKALISEVKRNLETLQQKFMRMKTKRGKMLKQFFEETEQGKFRGEELTSEHRRSTSVSDETERSFDGSIDSMLDIAVQVLEERFVKYFNGDLHSLFCVFDFNVWPNFETQADEFRVFGDESIEKLVDIYSPVLTNEERTHAPDEWLDLKMYVKDMTRRPPIDVFEGLLATAPDSLSHILPLVQILLTISPSTADCERGFSRMNRLKTSLRSSMGQETLRCLMKINLNGPPLNAFRPSKYVEHWLKSGPKHIHGHKLSTKKVLHLHQDL